MREESHLDAMRAAIRGDFERLERRRGSQELLHVSEHGEEGPPPATEPEPWPSEPAGELRPEGAPPAPTREPEAPVAEAHPEEPPHEEEPSPAPEPENPQSGDDRPRSWLDRLLGR